MKNTSAICTTPYYCEATIARRASDGGSADAIPERCKPLVQQCNLCTMPVRTRCLPGTSVSVTLRAIFHSSFCSILFFPIFLPTTAQEI